MKINYINQMPIENIYKCNNSKYLQIKQERKDTVQISDLGKYLNEVSKNKNEEIDIERINELKKQINNGTYKIDSKDIAKKIIERMKGE